MNVWAQLTTPTPPPRWRGDSRVVVLMGEDEAVQFTPRKYRGQPKKAKKPRPAPWKAWTLIAPDSEMEARMRARPFVWRLL